MKIKCNEYNRISHTLLRDIIYQLRNIGYNVTEKEYMEISEAVGVKENGGG